MLTMHYLSCHYKEAGLELQLAELLSVLGPHSSFSLGHLLYSDEG